MASAKIHVANPEDNATEVRPINTSEHYSPIRIMPATAQTDEATASGDTVFIPDAADNDNDSCLYAGSRSMHDDRAAMIPPVIVAIPLSPATVPIAQGRRDEYSSGSKILRADGEVTRLWVITAERPLSGLN